MHGAYTTRRSIFSLPRDYVRRRRKIRRITNFVLILFFSLITAWVVTRQSGSPAFTLPRTADKSAVLEATSRQLHSPAATPSGTEPAATSAAPEFPDGYHLQAGPFVVAEVPDLVLHDAKRNKDLHVRIFYPSDPGRYPVILFSHGAGGSQTCCDALTRHWASFGYVTLQPTHDDSAIQRRNSGEEDIRFMQAVRDALKKPALWESRPQDISFLIDSLAELPKRVPVLSGKIDAAEIGVGGHSMGSYTAEAIAGARIDLPGHAAANFGDPRVKAVLCLSPQGPGQFGLTDHSFDQISVPFIGMTGSLDSLGPIASPAWHKVPFARSEAGDKFHVFIQGANHMSFITAQTLSPSRSAQAEAILGYTNSASLAFWDAYLKKDAAAKKYLQSSALAASSAGAVTVDRR